MQTSQQTQEQPVTTEVASHIQNTLRALEIEGHNARLGYDFIIRAAKRQMIVGALVRNKWNQCKATRDLHMHRNTLGRTMAELGIYPPEKFRRKWNGRKPADVSNAALKINAMNA